MIVYFITTVSRLGPSNTAYSYDPVSDGNPGESSPSFESDWKSASEVARELSAGFHSGSPAQMLHVTMNLRVDFILPKDSLSIIDCLLKLPLAKFYKALPVYRLQRHDQAATSPLCRGLSTEWPAKHNQNTLFSR
jgi:hypothetical protein